MCPNFPAPSILVSKSLHPTDLSLLTDYACATHRVIFRRACYSWKFAGCIIFWLCLFYGCFFFSRFLLHKLFNGFRCWSGWAFLTSFQEKMFHTNAVSCRFVGMSPQGTHTFGMASGGCSLRMVLLRGVSWDNFLHFGPQFSDNSGN